MWHTGKKFCLNVHVVYIFKEELDGGGFTLREYTQSWVLLKFCCWLSAPQQWMFGKGDCDSTCPPFISLILSSSLPNMTWAESLPLLIPSFSSNRIFLPIPPHSGKSKFPPFQSSLCPALFSLHVISSITSFACHCLSWPSHVSFLFSFLEKKKKHFSKMPHSLPLQDFASTSVWLSPRTILRGTPLLRLLYVFVHHSSLLASCITCCLLCTVFPHLLI